MKTQITTPADIKRTWHIVDVKGTTLGRIATQIAKQLMGKSKPYFVRNLDCGDYVVVVNAKEVEVTGKKNDQKIYTQFSGYPGGLKKETFAQLQKRKPTQIIQNAVYGMLPKNKLRDSMIKRLYIYADDKHPYAEKFQTKE